MSAIVVAPRLVTAELAYTARMKQRPLSPRRLDIAAFIDGQASLHESNLLSDFPRLSDSLAPDASAEQRGKVEWQAEGILKPQRVGPPQQWLSLAAQALLPFTCQRCLHPVVLPVSTERLIRFVGDESVAAELDADMDEDVLVLARAFDLLALVEDEMIMASPIVPRHDECPEAPTMYVADPGVEEEDRALALGDATGEPAANDSSGAPTHTGQRPHPFAVLAKLKKTPEGGDSGGNNPA